MNGAIKLKGVNMRKVEITPKAFSYVNYTFKDFKNL